jgi:ABC-type oligopeptide transport system ATPase subunit
MSLNSLIFSYPTTLSVVKFISDRIVVMNKGEIEEIGYADDIYNNPTKDYTKGLISAIPKGELEDIRRKMSQVSSLMLNDIQDRRGCQVVF